MLVSVKRTKISPKITHLNWGASNTGCLPLNMIAGAYDLHLILCFVNVHEIWLSFLRISHVFVRSSRKWKSICLLFSVFLSAATWAQVRCVSIRSLAWRARRAWRDTRRGIQSQAWGGWRRYVQVYRSRVDTYRWIGHCFCDHDLGLHDIVDGIYDVI